MSDSQQDSKTEAPSEKHLSDALEKGQFAKSPEIALVLMLVAALGAFSLTAGSSARDIGAMASHVFSRLGTIEIQVHSLPLEITEIGIVLGKCLGPILAATVLAAVLAGGLQSGFNFTPEALGIRFENLDPSRGWEKLFSKAVLVHAGVDLLKLIAIGLVLWTAARGLLQDPLFSAPVEASYLGVYLDRTTMAFLSRLVLALGTIAGISYWYEFHKSRRDLMMTRQEVKDERKQADGDQLVKGAMRRMARRFSQKQMLKQVATADVIVTNPTHYAVALRYERGMDHAPVVLAKGENQFARRIKAMGAEHGVPQVENKPVARLLYALGRVDEPIPNELYQAVAEILAVVYRTHRYYFYRLRSRRAEEPKTETKSKKTVSRAHPSSSDPTPPRPDREDRARLSEAA